MKAATRTLFPLVVAFLVLLGTGTFPLQATAAPPPGQQQTTYANEIAALLDLHNQVRAEHGLGSLRYSPTLAVQFSQPYNDELAESDADLVHQDLGPLVAWPGATGAAENLFWGSGSLGTPEAAMEGWMESDGHRKNILNGDYTYIAIGWSRSPGGRAYSTVNFWSGDLTGLGTTYPNGKALLAAEDTDVDVYTTPGKHVVAGRQWNTTCSEYTDFVDRCRAEIWATTVTYANGAYSQGNTWVFNNLTYFNGSRSYWGSNPLANDREWTSSGRKWETSCDDAWTGPNGCRTFVYSDVVQSYIDATGNRAYRILQDHKVFNNVVAFS